MRSVSKIKSACFFLLSCLASLSVNAQSKKPSYNSLFWEITGNNLKKPSYLFGTMHLSNKMVFHLSDSFFTAIKNADVVALELNPEDWQNDMQRLEKGSKEYSNFYSNYYTDYLQESTFTSNDFLGNLRGVLRYVPAVNNQLLYRTDKWSEDYQEDTYLDLYIYQTGKRLGKQTAGVETFMGAQQMEIEARVDAALEEKKKPKTNNKYSDGVNAVQAMQDAYRRGDLDMLDSLTKESNTSDSYTEKFLYKRNETQANSMDSIMRNKSLFVGVGAAHLPGERGVIELLRKKGYKLRPIFMQDKDAIQKRSLDSLTAKVHFHTRIEKDSAFSVSIPGNMNEIAINNGLMHYYGDMSNGAFYMITRLRTNTIFSGQNATGILKIVDSILYENIPGTILSKKSITKNGYNGIDIVNKTKNADIQHYQLIVTPSELLVFKMSGKGDYVFGKEADTFFNSIKIKEQPLQSNWQFFSPDAGGFKVKMPAPPQSYYTSSANDRLPEWRYETSDPATQDNYVVFKKSIYSFGFIEADTFDLSLMEESLGSNSDWTVDKPAHNVEVNGRIARDISFKTKNGMFVEARAVLFGPQYYLLVHSGKGENTTANAFFNSFEFTPFKYPEAQLFRDTIFHYEVKTNVSLDADKDVTNMFLYVKKNEQLLKNGDDYNNDLKKQTVNFTSEETGEVIIANTYKAPIYFYKKDSLKFINQFTFIDSSLVLQSKTSSERPGGTKVWQMVWADTASTRLIKELVLQNGMYLTTINTMVDKNLPESSFIKDFYASFNFYGIPSQPSIFDVKENQFFKDFYDKDTVVSKQAKSALSSVYYDKNGYPQIIKAIQSLKPGDKDYFSLKSRFIDELGYLEDTSITANVMQSLKKIYTEAGDTSTFQNSALKALTRLRRPEATALFKQLMLQDPPVFENSYEYFALFNVYKDSLQLAKALYPDLLQLSSIDDYKIPIRSLLANLVDSNYLKPEVYESYLGSIFFDAKVELKKEKSSHENETYDGNDAVATSSVRKYLSNYSGRNNAVSDSDDGDENYFLDQSGMTYFKLLVPYYHKNQSIQNYFQNISQLKNSNLKLNGALTLLKYKIPVSDTVWNDFANDKKWRYQLYLSLKSQNRLDLMPAKYNTVEAVAHQVFYNNVSDIDTMESLRQQNIIYQGKPATIFFYKYKLKNNDDWALGILGMNQEKGKPVQWNNDLYRITEKKMDQSNTAVITKQENEELKKLLIINRNSGSHFYQAQNRRSYNDDDSE